MTKWPFNVGHLEEKGVPFGLEEGVGYRYGCEAGLPSKRGIGRRWWG
jgi:hypothetical protein